MEKRKMKPGAFLRRYIRVIAAGIVLLCIFMMAFFAPVIATHDPMQTDMYNMNQLPNEEHIMGTDCYGRDLFSRIVYGSRMSLIISITVNVCAIVIGTCLGLLVGYFKWADRIIMRILEGIRALPMIVFAITLITVLGSGVDKLLICLTVVNLPGIARLVRSQVLSIREKEFVECAKANGASNLRIMFKYILPQCTSPLIIRFTSGLGNTILTQASLSFLGVGLDPRIPNWGGIINEAKNLVMIQPHQCGYAGLAIMITVLAFSIMGDGLRDILDPRLR
ncbi:MAG: ABC transporter permease [Oscillospiraceae bacterium]|nr:ABC transporter permease [Oscillospiraceae bacterium]